MTQQLTLADLELPPGTLDGFTPEQIAEVVQAATDGACAAISRLLGRPHTYPLTGGWAARERDLDVLAFGTVLVDEDGNEYRKSYADLWACWLGLTSSEHVLAEAIGRLSVVGGGRDAAGHEGVMDDARIQLEVSR